MVPVRDLVRALGGPSRVAARCRVGITAVSNWGERGAIPPRHHLELWKLAREQGVDWVPPGADGLALTDREAA